MDALPLPMDVIGDVFDRLMRVYGTRFTSTYAGQDPYAVRSAWAHELRGLTRSACEYALELLPADYAPNVLQFRSLAQAAPRPAERVEPAPAPMAQPERIKAALARLSELHEQPVRRTAVEVWQRVLANPRSTLTAREMATAALQRLGAA